MKVFQTILFFFSFIICSISFGQSTNLRAYLDNKQFHAPGTGNYIELYFQFVGHSVHYNATEEGLQGELAVFIQISENDSIIYNDGYRLQTPVMKDSIIDDFYDVKRIALNPGKYILSIELQDLNTSAKPIKASQPFVIDDLENSISISDIEIIEYAKEGNESSAFYKSGYEIIPRLSTFYPSQLSSIPNYLELYNTNQLDDSICLLKQYFVNMDNGLEMSDYTMITNHKTADVVPVLRNIDISKLPTGRYSLNYTLISTISGELSTQSYVFERSNDIDLSWDAENLVLDPSFQASISTDSVVYYLESLIPIARPTEIKNIITVLKTKDEEKARKHIQAFWLKTAPTSAYEAWLRYKAQVQLVEDLYANNFQEGFETDRGRVYLQYGSPTSIIIKEVSPSEYPYEIWQYNKIGAFSNKRFIFYNPDLVNNAYRLLHSDMMGELKNPSWPQILVKRNTTNGNVDDPNGDVQDHWGGNSNDLFRQY